MKINETPIHGAYLFDLEPHTDTRGHFVRVFDQGLFAQLGLNDFFPQHNVAFNRSRGTLRGLHYQLPPWGEVKVVHCIRGELHDVLVDIRSDSPTFRSVASFRLNADEPKLLYIPEGVAHGYQTTTDDSAVHYLMGSVYRPDAQRGIAWDEPLLDIDWPVADPILSGKDRVHPPLDWDVAWSVGD